MPRTGIPALVALSHFRSCDSGSGNAVSQATIPTGHRAIFQS